MSSKNISNLREHLFDSIEGLKSGTMEVKTALAISEIGRTLIETAKVELHAQRLAGSTRSSAFIQNALEEGETPRALPPAAPDEVDHRYGYHAGRCYARVVKESPDGQSRSVVLVPVSRKSLMDAVGEAGIEMIPTYKTFDELQRTMGVN